MFPFFFPPRYNLSFLLARPFCSVLGRLRRQTIPKSRGRALHQRRVVGHAPTHPERVTWPCTNPRQWSDHGTRRSLHCRSSREHSAARWVGGMRRGPHGAGSWVAPACQRGSALPFLLRVQRVTEGETCVLVSASRFLFSGCFLAGKEQTFLCYLSERSVMLLAGDITCSRSDLFLFFCFYAVLFWRISTKISSLPSCLPIRNSPLCLSPLFLLTLYAVFHSYLYSGTQSSGDLSAIAKCEKCHT